MFYRVFLSGMLFIFTNAMSADSLVTDGNGRIIQIQSIEKAGNTDLLVLQFDSSGKKLSSAGFKADGRAQITHTSVNTRNEILVLGHFQRQPSRIFLMVISADGVVTAPRFISVEGRPLSVFSNSWGEHEVLAERLRDDGTWQLVHWFIDSQGKLMAVSLLPRIPGWSSEEPGGMDVSVFDKVDVSETDEDEDPNG